MNSSIPIPLLQRPVYAEGSALAPARDGRNNAFLWKKAKTDQAQMNGFGQAFQKLSRQVSKQRRRIVGGFVPTPAPLPFYPFRIYQPSNVGQFTTGYTFLDPTSGVATVCNIDSTQPTNFAATPPTVNPKTDPWRFWSVRSGQVEIRPIYTLLALGTEYLSPTGDNISDPNNWGWKYMVNLGTDGVNPSQNSVQKVNEFTAQTDETVFPPLIIPKAVGAGAPVGFYIWIRITPDVDATALPSVLIEAGRNDDVFGSHWPDSSPNVIPVGIVSNVFEGADGFGNYSLSNMSVEQFIFDHQTNLFPKGNGNFGGGGVLNIRGGYNAVRGNYNPTDLLTQVGYPGDVFGYTTSSTYNVQNGLYCVVSPVPNFIAGFSPFGASHNFFQEIVPFDTQPS